MRTADDGIEVDDRHDSVLIWAEVRFDNPEAVIRVGVSKRLAEFVDEGALELFVPEYEREEEMHPCNFKTPYPSYVRPSGDEHTITAGCHDTTCLPPWGRPDGFTIQSLDTRIVARGTENCFGGMEDGYVLDGLEGWTGREGGGSIECGVLLIKQEPPDERFEILLLDVSTKPLKRSDRVPACCNTCQKGL